MSDGLEINLRARYCDGQRRPAPHGQQPVHFSGRIETCDLCQQPLAGLQYFADCRLIERDEWGILCQDCVANHQIKFGWGIGQLYAYQSDGDAQWRLVAGYPVTDTKD